MVETLPFERDVFAALKPVHLLAVTFAESGAAGQSDDQCGEDQGLNAGLNGASHEAFV